MMSIFLKQFSEKKSGNKRKIENIVFLIIILVITLILMKYIWKDNTGDLKTKKENNMYIESSEITSNNDAQKYELEEKMEKILSTIKGVGDVNVFINYSESSSSIPLYDESTTTSTTTEGDSSGGTRNTVETENQKEVVFTEKSGTKDPVIQKTTMPLIEGAIITAQGANNAEVKTNIINAVQAATGLSIDRVQVFEMKWFST